MRRKDREITDTGEILGIIDQCKVCRLGLSDNGQPYIVPLNFGYTFLDGALALYFHSAPEGRKIDILKGNNRVCFEIDTGHRLIEADTACGHGFAYASVIGFGAVSFIDGPAEKSRALDILMRHQTGKALEYRYGEKELNAVSVFVLSVTEFTGKRRLIPKP